MLKYLLLLSLFSCASPFVVSVSSLSIKDEHVVYDYKDTSGEMLMEKVVKYKDKKVITSRKLYNNNLSNKKMLERSVTVSELGLLTVGERQTPLLRPFVSQYTVWFDGKEYFTQMKLNKVKKSLDILLKSPEEKWNGTKTIQFPTGIHFCFFSQVVECLKSTGFFKQAIEQKAGSLDLVIIWDTYPYFSEIYANLNEEVFSAATIKYETEDINKKKDDKVHHFSLDVNEQLILYEFNEKYEFEKFYWIAQGVTMERKQRKPVER
ncbi:MAG: hypothetical protein JNM93_03960 [Bacteriovoracaceae bacterium]|nr:hypothetical protein [Bacteriovoracaceae bacterium]